jgi:hypothetical protein
MARQYIPLRQRELSAVMQAKAEQLRAYHHAMRREVRKLQTLRLTFSGAFLTRSRVRAARSEARIIAQQIRDAQVELACLKVAG